MPQNRFKYSVFKRLLPIFGTLFILFSVLPAKATFQTPSLLSNKQICFRLLEKTGEEGTLTLNHKHLHWKYISSQSHIRVLEDSELEARHEYISSEVVETILEKNESALLLTPRIHHLSIPAFDGVIFDKRGNVIANYSLKSILKSNSTEHQVHTAISKATEYSHIESWIKFLNLNPEKFEKALEKLQDLVWLFGVDQHRPTYVFIHIADSSSAPLPTNIEIEQLIEEIKNNTLITKIYLIKENNYWEITTGGVIKMKI
jgi:hypothetical protein